MAGHREAGNQTTEQTGPNEQPDCEDYDLDMEMKIKA